MELYAHSDKQLQRMLGERIKQLRLQRNVTQQALSEALNVSLSTIKALEKGRSKLATFIAVLRELDALDKLHDLLEGEPISPRQLAKLRGKTRIRASVKHRKSDNEMPW